MAASDLPREILFELLDRSHFWQNVGLAFIDVPPMRGADQDFDKVNKSAMLVEDMHKSSLGSSTRQEHLGHMRVLEDVIVY